MRDQPEYREGVEFVLRLARALHAHGAPAHRLEDAMSIVTPHIGVEGQFLSTPTSLMAAFGTPPDQQTYLIRIEPGTVNLGVLAELDRVIAEFTAHKLTPREGQQRLERILSHDAPYPAWVAMACLGVAAASTARFIGGGAREVVTAGALGLTTGLLLAQVGRRPTVSPLFEPIAATLASFIACAAAVLFPPTSPFVASVAGLIVLLPGLTLTTALTELGTRNLVSGTARLALATMTFLGIGAGLALGAGVARRIWGTIPNPSPVPLPMWTELVALAVAPLALTVLFRARWREAGWIMAACVLAFCSARAASALLGPEIGTFVAAVISASAANLYARVKNRTTAVLQVPAILFLIPGSMGVRSVSSLIANDVISGLGFAVTLVLTALGLAAGVLTANIVVARRRPL